MQPGALVFDAGFTLHDAMAAFEVHRPDVLHLTVV